MPDSTTDRFSPWPHRWAWLLACATFPLVWWGGFVTATGAGMAFREWLMPDGHFVLTYPWLASTGDKFHEHGHRLLGAAAGLLSIVLVVVAYRCEPRRWVRLYTALLLAGVIGQGALGALRVVLDRRTLALIHGCTGPLFFMLCAGIVVVTSPWWVGSVAVRDGMQERRLVRWAAATTALAYGQLVLGACLRHGRLLISDSAATIFRTSVYLHVAVAVIVGALIIGLVVRAARVRLERPLAWTLLVLVAGQLLLGLTTWLMLYGQPRWAADWFGPWNYLNREASLLRAIVVTAHGAVGSLIVACAFAMSLRGVRQLGWRAPQWSPGDAEGLKGASA